LQIDADYAEVKASMLLSGLSFTPEMMVRMGCFVVELV
jgi:hypothetical protein